MPCEDAGGQVAFDGRRERINQRLQELEEQNQRTQRLGEIAQGMIAKSQQYRQLMQVWIEHAQGLGQIIHEPSRYPEGGTEDAEGIKDAEEAENQERKEKQNNQGG